MATAKEMAKSILEDGKIRGKDISEKQRAFFQDVLDGKREMGQTKKKDNSVISSRLV